MTGAFTDSDAAPPLASLGHGVWRVGQSIQNAEVWGAVRAGLQDVMPFGQVEPVIQTGDAGLEPSALPEDPTGTGRFE